MVCSCYSTDMAGTRTSSSNAVLLPGIRASRRCVMMMTVMLVAVMYSRLKPVLLQVFGTRCVSWFCKFCSFVAVLCQAFSIDRDLNTLWLNCIWKTVFDQRASRCELSCGLYQSAGQPFWIKMVLMVQLCGAPRRRQSCGFMFFLRGYPVLRIIVEGCMFCRHKKRAISVLTVAEEEPHESLNLPCRD